MKISQYEKNVTKLLSKSEILPSDKISYANVTNPIYDLGGFLHKISLEPKRFEGKYMFIE